MRTTLNWLHGPTALACLLSLTACGDAGGTDETTSGPTSDPTGDPTGTAPSSTGATTGNSDPTTGGDDNSASGTTTAPDSTTSSTTATTSTTADDTTGGTTTVTPETTTGDDTTGDDTTGGNVGCGFEGPEIDATLVHVGDPPPPCGTIEFVGQNQVNSPGPIYELDGCPCGNDCFAPDPWIFTLDVPNPAFLPNGMADCPRIVVERQMSKQGCELVGVTIFDTQPTTFPNPYYIAGSLLGPPAAAAADLTIEQTVVETCDCDFCCNSPERYDLEFEIGGEMLSLPEGGFGPLGDPNIPHYSAINFQSHYSGICDDSPAIDWVLNMVPLN